MQRTPERTHASLTGQAGVWAVASQLALRGLIPHFPGVDFGYDVMVDGGIRIQVKAARKQPKRQGWGAKVYWFKMWKPAYASGNNKIHRGRPRDYSSDCDFVVFWGIDENRFWIVPATLISKTCSIVLGPEGFYKRSEFPETRALAVTGMTPKQIAERLGITVQGVMYQLRGGRLRKPNSTIVAQVRELEGRWDLITGALATLREASDIVAEPQTVSAGTSA